MAIHDPDASAQEKAQALKIGRQKRLQLINGQQVRNWFIYWVVTLAYTLPIMHKYIPIFQFYFTFSYASLIVIYHHLLSLLYLNNTSSI